MVAHDRASMLLADKNDLHQRLKLNLIQIDEKELNFYTQNCYTLGTQAALLSGFAFTAIVEARDEADAESSMQIVWSASTVLAMVFELMTVVKSMQLSIMAPGLALRGPEGSMTRAVLVMRAEYKVLHRLFYAGLVFFHVSAALYATILLGFWIALASIILVALALIWLAIDYRLLARKLQLPVPLPTSGRSTQASRPRARRWDPVSDARSEDLRAVGGSRKPRDSALVVLEGVRRQMDEGFPGNINGPTLLAPEAFTEAGGRRRSRRRPLGALDVPARGSKEALRWRTATALRGMRRVSFSANGDGDTGAPSLYSERGAEARDLHSEPQRDPPWIEKMIELFTSPLRWLEEMSDGDPSTRTPEPAYVYSPRAREAMRT